MRKTLLFFVALGCGGASPDGDGTTLSGVMTVENELLESNTWYIDATVSDAPVLASEVQDTAGAVGVRLLVARDFVAAVSATGIEGAWSILHTRAGSTEPGGDTTVDTTTPEGDGPQSGFVATEDALTTVTVDWGRDFQLSPEEQEELQAIHPGCI